MNLASDLIVAPEDDIFAQKLEYTPSPTFEKFHSDSNHYRVVIGPYGGGKTSGCCMEIFTRSLEMPVCMDGIRRARWMCVRNTYPELETTTILTWKEWFPEDRFGRFINSKPAIHRMDFVDHEGVRCQFEIYFVALANMASFKKVLGLELTGIFFNEVREIDGDIVRAVYQRVGRYPVKHLPKGTDFFSGVICDTNPPAEDSWLYKKIEEEKPDSWSFFWQPPAMIQSAKDTYRLNPQAENIQNLKPNYYEEKLKVHTREEVKVYLLQKYGTINAGMPCYSQFYRQTHVVSQTEPMELDPSFPIYLGWDFGLTPCVVIAQFISGQLRVIAEYQSFDTHLDDFLEIVFLPEWFSKYAHWSSLGLYVSIADPYGGGQRNQVDGQTCIKKLQLAGIDTHGVDFKLYGQQERLAAVNHFLRSLSMGDPAFKINRACRYLIAGFEGRYKFAEKTASGMKFTSEKVEDGDHTHSQDALQAICLHVRKNSATMNDANKYQTSELFSAGVHPF